MTQVTLEHAFAGHLSGMRKLTFVLATILTTTAAPAWAAVGPSPGASVEAPETEPAPAQFTYETWAAVGGSGDPAQAPEAEQDRRAATLYETSGPGQWPVCGQ